LVDKTVMVLTFGQKNSARTRGKNWGTGEDNVHDCLTGGGVGTGGKGHFSVKSWRDGRKGREEWERKCGGRKK